MKKLVIVLLPVALLFSCKDKVYDCPSTDEQLHEFFPYSMGDTLRFKSGSTIRTIPVTGIYYTDPYTCTERGGLLMVKECECEREGNISAVGDSGMFSVYINVTGKDKPFTDMQIAMNDLIFNTGMTFIDKWYISGENTSEQQNVQVNSVNYPSVVVYEADTINAPQLKVWKLMFVRGVGVVKYYERLPNKEWEKI